MPDLRQRYCWVGQVGGLAGVSKLWTRQAVCTGGHRESFGWWGKLHAVPLGVLPLPRMGDHRARAGRTAEVQSGGLWWELRGQRRHQVSVLMHRHILQVRLGTTSDQQAWCRDGSCHAGHSGWDGRRATAGHAEWQGHRNAVAFQLLLKSRHIHFFTSKNDDIKCAVVECFQRTLPLGHDSLPHDSQ